MFTNEAPMNDLELIFLWIRTVVLFWWMLIIPGSQGPRVFIFVRYGLVFPERLYHFTFLPAPWNAVLPVSLVSAIWKADKLWLECACAPWLMRLRIISCACYPFIYFSMKYVHNHLPIFMWPLFILLHHRRSSFFSYSSINSLPNTYVVDIASQIRFGYSAESLNSAEI